MLGEKTATKWIRNASFNVFAAQYLTARHIIYGRNHRSDAFGICPPHYGRPWRLMACDRCAALVYSGEVQGGGGTLSSSLTEHANGSEPSKLWYVCLNTASDDFSVSVIKALLSRRSKQVGEEKKQKKHNRIVAKNKRWFFSVSFGILYIYVSVSCNL